MSSKRSQSFENGALGESLIFNILEYLGYSCSKGHKDEQIWDIFAVKNEILRYIEVKTDFKAAKTGNVYLETVVGDRLGYFFKYTADSEVIFAFVLPDFEKTESVVCFLPAKKLIMVDLTKLRYHFSKHASNHYESGGYLYPVKELFKICSSVYIGIENNWRKRV